MGRRPCSVPSGPGGGLRQPLAAAARSQLYDQSERYRRLSVSLARQTRRIGDEHQAVVDAALGRDAEKAVALVTAHMTETANILLTAKINPAAAETRAASA